MPKNVTRLAHKANGKITHGKKRKLLAERIQKRCVIFINKKVVYYTVLE